MVQSFTAQGVSGIVLAPLNDKALVGAVKSAVQAKIPVVIFDSDFGRGRTTSSFVATDNLAAGQLGGRALGEAAGRQGQGRGAPLPGGVGEHEPIASKASSTR